ncbi:uncharacterized protein A1O5_02231 [Cladophialophora psammophila CBS 110553]|uniref:Uncharacterized protein n=1 Tax=Cladophialophora psammophila CBS 110553 TaxID=1182543 RepID=W9X0F1_9EURO|nr:uncharacterized protein A1O5_02231 [Cladophialophora psammophila CBS 110553]EXJ73937.1 hypothetical protein A1O5_02231 [Cladophialophora psammophila CBS 110553]
MSNSIGLVKDLLDQWTNLAEDRTAATTDEAEPSKTRRANQQTPKESSNTKNRAAEDAQDVWRNNYFQSQKRVGELEAELSKMKTAETKLASGRPAPGDHDEYETRGSPRKPSTKMSATPTKGSNRKDGESQEQGFRGLPDGGNGRGTRTYHCSTGGGPFGFSDPNAGRSSSGFIPLKPEIREESPPRTRNYPAATSAKYQIGDPYSDPEADDYERTFRVTGFYDGYDNRRYLRRTESLPELGTRRYHPSPEPTSREVPDGSVLREKNVEHPPADTRKSARAATLRQNSIATTQKTESGRFEDRPSPQSLRDTPPSRAALSYWPIHVESPRHSMRPKETLERSRADAKKSSRSAASMQDPPDLDAVVDRRRHKQTKRSGHSSHPK